MFTLNEALKTAGLPVKQQINEAASAAVKSFNAKKLNVADIIMAMEHAGVTDETEGYTQAVYGKWIAKSKSHMYYMLWEDENADDENAPFAINEIFIWIGESGFIEADTGGMPIADGMTKDAAVTKLATLKGK